MKSAYDTLMEQLKNTDIQQAIRSEYMGADELEATSTTVAQFNLQKADVIGKKGAKKLEEDVSVVVDELKQKYTNLGQELLDNKLLLMDSNSFSYQLLNYHDNKDGSNRNRRIALQNLNEVALNLVEQYYNTSSSYGKFKTAIEVAAYKSDRLKGIDVYKPLSSAPSAEQKLYQSMKELFNEAERLNQMKDQLSEFDNLYRPALDLANTLKQMGRAVPFPEKFLPLYWLAWHQISQCLSDYVRAIKLAEELKFLDYITPPKRLMSSPGQSPLEIGIEHLSQMVDQVLLRIVDDLRDLEYDIDYDLTLATVNMTLGKIKANRKPNLNNLEIACKSLEKLTSDLQGIIPTAWKTKYPALYS